MKTDKNFKGSLLGGAGPSGHVRFDDRGNAVWETWRGRRLEHPGLELKDEDPSAFKGNVPVNFKGGRLGYNPYESGLVKKRRVEKRGKKDLRALSRWIQMQKQVPQK